MESFRRINLSHIHPVLSFMDVKRLFNHLLDQLYQENLKNVILILSQSGVRFHNAIRKNGLQNADAELIKNYSSGVVREDILKFKLDYPQYILFTPKTFRLIHILLINHVYYNFENNEINDAKKNKETKVYSPGFVYKEFSLVGIALIANLILEHIDQEMKHLSAHEREIRNYYERCLIDPTSAIARAKMYDKPYFNEKLNEMYGISTNELIDAIFGFFAHVLNKDPAIIDPISSFNNFFDAEKQGISQVVLNLLSQKILGRSISIDYLIDTIFDDLHLDRYGRGKPFVKLLDRYYCFRPDLMSDALGDLPYHLIFTKLLENKADTNQLKDQRGSVYQDYIFSLTQSLLGEDICRNINLKKSGEYGDMIIDVSQNKILMIEIKLADLQDSHKKGNLDEIKKRFLLPPKRKRKNNNTPGPLQLMQRAMDYRKKFNFDGVIQTSVVYFGWFPEVNVFDELYSTSIKKNPICMEYENDKNNLPLILMNGFTWELILSTIKQQEVIGKNKQNELDSIFENLASKTRQPSEISSIIETYIKSQSLRFSVYPLFEQTIAERADICRKDLKK